MHHVIEPFWAEALLVAAVGLLFGSFTTLASYRLVHGERGIVAGRSRCTACRHALGVPDLFPVLSWLVLGARCRHCGVKVSAKYPAIELAQMTMFMAVYLRYGLTPEAVLLMALAVALLILIVVDLECLIIPDGVNLTVFAFGVLYAAMDEARWMEALLGSITGVVSGLLLRWFFTAWKKVEALGLGDVKFLGAAGLFLGLDLFISFLFLAGVIGIVTALLWRFADKGRQFPFGPALALGLFACVLFPEVQGLVREQVTEFLLKHMVPVGEV